MKTLKNIAAVLAVTALAIPAGVAAKGPSENSGKSGDHASKQNGSKSKRCKKQPRVGINATGTVVSYDAATRTVVVDIDKVSRHAKDYVNAAENVSVVAKEGQTITPGQAVKVHGKITKPKKKCPMTDEQRAASVTWTKVTPREADEETTTTTTTTV